MISLQVMGQHEGDFRNLVTAMRVEDEERRGPTCILDNEHLRAVIEQNSRQSV